MCHGKVETATILAPDSHGGKQSPSDSAGGRQDQLSYPTKGQGQG